jgi:hypothetical protein
MLEVLTPFPGIIWREMYPAATDLAPFECIEPILIGAGLSSPACT